MKIALCILASLFLIPKASTIAGQNDKAVTQRKLVSPSAYSGLPARVRKELQAHGCSLPATQSLDNGAEAINVVSGYFGGKDSLAWAAVCIIGDRPQIFLMWGQKRGVCPSEIHSGWPLKENFSTQASGEIFLRKATAQRILNYRQAFPEGPKPAITHDGLEVGNEQASLVYYCHVGKWLELRGND